MAIELVREPIALSRLREFAEEQFGDLVKAVVDVERQVLAVGAAMHADEEAALLEDGSSPEHLWGINLYPGEYGDEDWIEFDSLINIRPAQGNRSRDVEDARLKEQIRVIVGELVHSDA